MQRSIYSGIHCDYASHNKDNLLLIMNGTSERKHQSLIILQCESDVFKVEKLCEAFPLIDESHTAAEDIG